MNKGKPTVIIANTVKGKGVSFMREERARIPRARRSRKADLEKAAERDRRGP